MAETWLGSWLSNLKEKDLQSMGPHPCGTGSLGTEPRAPSTSFSQISWSLAPFSNPGFLRQRRVGLKRKKLAYEQAKITGTVTELMILNV